MSAFATVRNGPATLLALCAVALNLRPALATIGPVLEPLRTDLSLSYRQAGLLTTLPVLCMGLFAPLTPTLQTRFGSRNAILFATLLLGIATLLRAQTSYVTLLLSSLVTGAAIAVLGPLLSAFIKENFPQQGPRVSSWVTTALCIGAAFGAAGTASLSNAIGWSYSLAAWSGLAFIGAAWWHLSVPHVEDRASAQQTSLPWRSVRSWQLMLTFGLHSLVFYGLLAWLAPAYRDYGLSLVQAGRVLGWFALMQVAGTLAVSALPEAQRDRRPAMFVCGSITLLGLVLMWQAPLFAPYLWMCLLGAGTAGLFALTLILPLDYSRTAAEAGAWTAMMSSGGYVIAATGPLLTGWVRDVSGNYHQVFLLLTAISTVVLLSTLCLAPRHE